MDRKEGMGEEEKEEAGVKTARGRAQLEGCRGLEERQAGFPLGGDVGAPNKLTVGIRLGMIAATPPPALSPAPVSARGFARSSLFQQPPRADPRVADWSWQAPPLQDRPAAREHAVRRPQTTMLRHVYRRNIPTPRTQTPPGPLAMPPLQHMAT